MIKSEFKRRLIKLNVEINRALELDNLNNNLIPYLYQVISYLWCKNRKDLEWQKSYKKKK